MRDEYFVMFREGMALEVKNDDDTFKGKGHVHLTSHRLVFVREGDTTKHKKFSSMEIPHFLTHGDDLNGSPPEFHQPVFGANYLSSKFSKLDSAKYPVLGSYSLTFKNGKCESFVRAYHQIWRAAQKSAIRTGFTSPIIQQMQAGGHTAAVDPSDPSVVYIAQPQVEARSTVTYT
ncbi:MAG: uncharacterized protein KVP18_002154 [Porospora cf. gigantea A]|nr:MAG: hypothetical protein KVP18_002154 [Porospora cf. gigantea A]